MSTAERLLRTAIVVCLAAVCAVLLGSVAAAKKKHKKSSAAVVTRSVNAPIPDPAASTPTTNPPYGTLTVPLEIGGKRFKGMTVGDVQLTYQTTGLTATAAEDLLFRLTAPSGRAYTIGGFYSGQSIGPVTFTANSPVMTCAGSAPPPPPPCEDPDATLNPPYQGVASDNDLQRFIGAKMRGTWTFRAFDDTNTNTSVLNMVSLRVIPQKPVK